MSSSASSPRSGTYCGRVTSLASGTRSGFFHQVDNGQPKQVRFYLKVDTAPSADNRIFALATAISTHSYSVKLASDRTLKLFNLNTQAGSATSALTLGQWYRIEIEYVVGGSDECYLYVDGVLGPSFTNGAQLTATGIFLGGNGNAEAQTTGDWSFDDVAINDTSGTAQAAKPGAGSIVHLKPNATGDFANGSNGAGGGVGWDDMDEVTPDDATSYWLLQTDSSATSGDPDRIDVNCESMPTGGTPILIQVGARVMPATNASMSYVCRVKSQASGTVIEGTTKAITGTAWVTHDDTAATKFHSLTRYTDPQAGGAWTEALINAMQIGVRAPDGAPDVRITAMWAMLEYTPSAGTKSPPPPMRTTRFFRRDF